MGHAVLWVCQRPHNRSLPANVHIMGSSVLLGILPGPFHSFGHIIKPVSYLLCVSASHQHYTRDVENPLPPVKFHLEPLLLGHMTKPVP